MVAEDAHVMLIAWLLLALPPVIIARRTVDNLSCCRVGALGEPVADVMSIQLS